MYQFPNLFKLLIISTCLVFAGCGGAPASDVVVDGGTTGTDSSTATTQIGSGGGDSFVDGEASAVLVSANTSSATWTVGVVVVDGDNIAITDDVTVNFNSTCVATGLATLSSSTAATIAGRASVQYMSGSCTGIDTVQASVVRNGSIVVASVDLDIDAAKSDIDAAVVVTMGNGTGIDFEEGVIGATVTSVPAGGSTFLSVNLVEFGGESYATSVDVTFSSGCFSEGLSTFSSETVSSIGGLATTTYTSAGCQGSDVVTATAVAENTVLNAVVTLDVESDTVLSIQFVSIDEPILSLRGAGGVETTDVTFKIIGALGAPVVNESVSFSLQSVPGGVSIAEGKETGLTDINGEVSTTVQSGTVSTTFSVTATHDASGNSSSSQGITIFSGAPVDSKFSLSLEPRKPANAYDTDGVEVELNIIASDYFGNDVPDGTQVFFASPEFGNIDSQCTLVSGECSIVWRSAGQRPDDLRATIIAYTAGAEDYEDNNGNNVYDSQDFFSVEDDLPEAYADENDNGLYDVGELFVDSNENGEYDFGNMLWDGPCLSSVDESADCSGETSVNIWRQAVITAATNEPHFAYGEFSVDGRATWVEFSENSRLEITENEIGEIVFNVIISDDTSVDNVFASHALPEGTSITVELGDDTGGLVLSGATDYTVDEKAFASPIEFTLSYSDFSLITEPVTVTVTVDVADTENDTIYTWTVVPAIP